MKIGDKFKYSDDEWEILEKIPQTKSVKDLLKVKDSSGKIGYISEEALNPFQL